MHLSVAGSLEPLVDELGTALASPLADPFAAEVVVVPGDGLRRWLTARLATRLGATGGPAPDGVVANVDFLFPATLVRRALGDGCGLGAWAVGPLTWAVHDALLADPDHFGQSPDAVRARAIADLFDRYALHRPAMVRRWSRGDDVDGVGAPLADHHRWQPRLWRQVRAGLGGTSDVERLDDLVAELRASGTVAGVAVSEVLPPRVFLFGLASLPTPQLDVLAAMSAHVDVHVLAPTVSPARWRRMRHELGGVDGVPRPLPRGEDGFAARGDHPLVDSWGRPSREAHLLLLEAAAAVDASVEAPALPAPEAEPSLLQRLQHDLATDAGPPGPALDGSRRPPPGGGAGTTAAFSGTGATGRAVRWRSSATPSCTCSRTSPSPSRRATSSCSAPTSNVSPPSSRPPSPATPTTGSRPSRCGSPTAPSDRTPPCSMPWAACSTCSTAGSGPARSWGSSPAHRCERRSASNPATSTASPGGWSRPTSGGVSGPTTTRRSVCRPTCRCTRGGPVSTSSCSAPPWPTTGCASGPTSVVPFADVEGDDVEVAGRLADVVHRLDVAVESLRRPAPVHEWTARLATAAGQLCRLPDDDAWQWGQFERLLVEFAADATRDSEPRPTEVDPHDLAALVQDRLGGRRGEGTIRHGRGHRVGAHRAAWGAPSGRLPARARHRLRRRFPVRRRGPHRRPPVRGRPRPAQRGEGAAARRSARGRRLPRRGQRRPRRALQRRDPAGGPRGRVARRDRRHRPARGLSRPHANRPHRRPPPAGLVRTQLHRRETELGRALGLRRRRPRCGPGPARERRRPSLVDPPALPPRAAGPRRRRRRGHRRAAARGVPQPRPGLPEGPPRGVPPRGRRTAGRRHPVHPRSSPGVEGDRRAAQPSTGERRQLGRHHARTMVPRPAPTRHGAPAGVRRRGPRHGP